MTLRLQPKRSLGFLLLVPVGILADHSCDTFTTAAHASNSIVSRSKKGRILNALLAGKERNNIKENDDGDDGDGDANRRERECQPFFQQQNHASFLTAVRGGSHLMAVPNDTVVFAKQSEARKKKIRPSSRYNQEIDAYIDFLIATSCIDDYTPEKADTEPVLSKRKAFAEEEEQPHIELSILASSSTGDSNTKPESPKMNPSIDSANEGVPTELTTTTTTTTISSESSSVDTATASANTQSAKQKERNGFANDNNSAEIIIPMKGDPDKKKINDGDGNDDNDDDDKENQLLDQYIEFLQEDFEQDRRLDRYIEFIEQDYDTDRTLDHYIDFLLATTSATALQQPSTVYEMTPVVSLVQNIATMSPPPVTETGTIDIFKSETVVVAHPNAADGALVSPLQSTIQNQLDDYIDQLVTAVELDEYIDRLIESISIASLASNEIDTTSKQKSSSTNEEDVTVQENEEIMSADVIDDYIDSIISASENEDSKKNVPSSAVKATTSSPHGDDDDDDDEDEEKNDTMEVSPNDRSPEASNALKQQEKEKESPEKDEVATSSIRIAKKVSPLAPADGSDDDDFVTSNTKTFTNKEISQIAELENKDAQDTGKVSLEKKRKKKKKTSGIAMDDPGTTSDAASNSTARESEESVRSPNGLYRFLLTKGAVGHAMVMLLVLFVEWIEVYIPQFADVIALLWLKLAPAGLQRRLAPRQYTTTDGRTRVSSLQQMYSGRMPVKGKQRKQLSKRADEEALAQLQRIGNIQDAKYKQVSQDFMKRHGLGPYESGKALAEYGGEPLLEKTTSRTKEKVHRRKSPYQGDEEEESDVEWVLQGLSSITEGKRRSQRSSMKPSVSIGIGSNGPSMQVGFEVGLVGNKSNKTDRSRTRASLLSREAITRDEIRKKSPGPRPGDRNGGSGVMGRLRAAATSNNLVSSRLLGAYPGDVVAPSEAAGAGGVADLAQKYGYGEWSDDDDGDDADDDDNVLAKLSEENRTPKGSQTHTRRKRNVKKSSKDNPRGFEEDSFSLAGLADRSAPTTASSRERRSKGTNRKHSRPVTKVRPPVDLLSEAKESSRKKGRRTKSKSTSSDLDVLKKKSEEKSKVVRPALENLKEARRKQEHGQD